MEKNLGPMTKDEAEAKVAELVPLAIEVLHDMLTSAKKVSNADLNLAKAKPRPLQNVSDPKYSRLDLEVVKATLTFAGIGKPDATRGKDRAALSAEQIASLLDKAHIIEHAPVKSLKVLE